jgi:16S rRNA (guanine527-N7)-methyltransferase
LLSGASAILGRDLVAREIAAFDAYVDELLTWQRHTRLVGSADPGWIVEHLLLDSLLFVRFLGGSGRVLDLGSGAGVPGIPVKIVAPWLSMSLVEARRKRASFLAAVIRRLGLAGVEVLGMRCEEALRSGAIRAESFDAVVSRSAAAPERIAALGRNLLRPGGTLVIAGSPGADLDLRRGLSSRSPSPPPPDAIALAEPALDNGDALALSRNSDPLLAKLGAERILVPRPFTGGRRAFLVWRRPVETSGAAGIDTVSTSF